MKKISLILALVMVVTCFAACAGKTDPADTSAAAGTNAGPSGDVSSKVPEDTARYDAEGFLMDDLPALDFGQKHPSLPEKQNNETQYIV